MKQECIPVGCIPSAAVAAGEGGEHVSKYPSMHWAGVCVSQHALTAHDQLE